MDKSRKKALKELAEVIKEYTNQLKRQGFEDMEALLLAANLQDSIMQMNNNEKSNENFNELMKKTHINQRFN